MTSFGCAIHKLDYEIRSFGGKRLKIMVLICHFVYTLGHRIENDMVCLVYYYGRWSSHWNLYSDCEANAWLNGRSLVWEEYDVGNVCKI